MSDFFKILDKYQLNPTTTAKTVQESFQFQTIFEDGICQIDESTYSKTIEFNDTNYQLAQDEDKIVIFSRYCSFLNYFDANTTVQLTFFNQSGYTKKLVESISITHQEDDFNGYRDEYSSMQKAQFEKGKNNSFVRKFITFSIKKKHNEKIKPRLEAIERDILANFKKLNVKAKSLDGKERALLLKQILSLDSSEKESFYFNENEIEKSLKDYLAPPKLVFDSPKFFKLGEQYGTASLVKIEASELEDTLLKDVIEAKDDSLVTIFFEPYENIRAIKKIKGKIRDLNADVINHQKKAVQAGFDMDILPSDLKLYTEEAKEILKDIQSKNERYFMMNFQVINFNKKKTRLDSDLLSLNGIVQSHNCSLVTLDYQQEDALMSALPIGLNKINIKRGVTTSNLAILMPFTTQELFNLKGFYYGLNSLSNSIIKANRKSLKAPNGLIVGSSGSGKSFAAKREIANCFLTTEDDIIICDPEAEYLALVKAFGGEVIKMALNSKDYINPLEISFAYGEDDDPIRLKSDFILSFMEIISSSKNGLEPTEKSLLDKCTRLIYKDYLNNPIPDNMPILEDLYNVLLEQETAEARRLAACLELYTTGSFNYFNHRSTIDTKSRIICFDIKELGSQLKKIGMLIVQDQVWNRVSKNRADKKYTWFYIDEFHLLLKDEQTSNYFIEFWKRFRKWGGIPTGITQNIKDFFQSREIENILENSEFILMLNQKAGDQKILSQHLTISENQLPYITNSDEGEGLLFFGNIILPFRDKFPKETKLYELMTSKLDDKKENK